MFFVKYSIVFMTLLRIYFLCKKVKIICLIRAHMFVEAVTVQVYRPGNGTSYRCAMQTSKATYLWAQLLKLCHLSLTYISVEYGTPCIMYQGQNTLTNEITSAFGSEAELLRQAQFYSWDLTVGH